MEEQSPDRDLAVAKRPAVSNSKTAKNVLVIGAIILVAALVIAGAVVLGQR